MAIALESHARWTPPADLVELAFADAAILAEVLDAFTVDADARVRSMDAALSMGDAARLRAQAHAMEGGAGQIGADDLASLCRELELASGMVDSPRLASMVERIQSAYGGLRLALARYSARRGEEGR
jgi:HPt (histidine-containing phosphotransfer) domain-containing protein